MNPSNRVLSQCRGIASAAIVLSLAVVALRAHADTLLRLPSHVPAWTAGAIRKERVAAKRSLRLDLTLVPRDMVGLKSLLHHLYTPGDPLYRHYLTPQQVADRFAPSQPEYDAVTHWAAAQGFQVTPHTGRLLVGLTAPAATVERAFALHLNTYLAADKVMRFAPDSDPAVPAAFAGLVRGVVGLHSSPRPNSSSLKVLSPTGHLFQQSKMDYTGSGPGGLFAPTDIVTGYKFDWITQNNQRLMGEGQTVALVEFDGFLAQDLLQYRKKFRLGPANLVVKQVDGATGSIASAAGQAECELDIDMVSAIAPKARVLVYEAPNDFSTFAQYDTYALDLYTQIVEDDLAPVVSTSWYNGYETDSFFEPGFATSLDLLLMNGALQGQSFFAPAGDNGAYSFSLSGIQAAVQYPGTSPYICSVGGTALTLNRGHWYGETSWNTFTHDSTTLYGGGGGGGVSVLETIPDWQLPFATFNNQQGGGASETMRNVPDVALNASDASPYAIYLYSNTPEQGWYGIAGTSAAAPLWASFAAIVNQYRIPNGLGSVGFIDPALYNAAARYYLIDYHDIHDNSTNGFDAETLSWLAGFGYAPGPGYPAIRYYDLSTGLGTPYAYNLFEDLVNEGGSTALLDAPQLSALPGNGYVKLDWNAVKGASAYVLYRLDSLSSDPTGVPLATVMGTTSYLDTTAKNGVAYTYFIYATGPGGTSFYSVAIASPGQVHIIAGPAYAVPGSILVSTDVLSQIEVRYGTNKITLKHGAADHTYSLDHNISLPGLVSGKTYYYRVYASDGVVVKHTPLLSFVAF